MKLTLDTLHHYCDADGDCMVWRLGCNAQGYPIARIDGAVQNVRRLVCGWRRGKALSQRHVVGNTGTCHTPRCVEHIHATTRGRLIARSYASGHRSRSGEYHARVAAYIELGYAKLDWAKVREIRSRRDEGSTALAAEFGVDVSTLKHVLAGSTWIEHMPAASVFAWRAAA